MAKVVRYFHIRPQQVTKNGEIKLDTRGGATVKVTGDTEDAHSVNVQVAMCSVKDTFWKARGRSLAEERPSKVVALRYLPQELASIGAVVDRKSKSLRVPRDYTFSLKYFLPKE